MPGIEGWTVLATLDAIDEGAEAFASYNEGLKSVAEQAEATAEAVRAAGESIDESLGVTSAEADVAVDGTAEAQAGLVKTAESAQAAGGAAEEAAGGLGTLGESAAGAAIGLKDTAAAAEAAETAAGGYTAEARAAAAVSEQVATSGAAAGTGADTAAAGLDKAAGAASAYADAAKGATAADDEVAGSSRAAAGAQDEAATASGEAATASTAAGDATAGAGAKADEAAAGGLSKYKMALLGVGVGAGLAVVSAAKFQQQTTTLVTSAGESASQLGMLQQGILKISAQTATSSSQLTSGLYMISSAGITGAGGLNVLKAAAMGAKAEGADLSTVTSALTSGINAYGMKTGTAAQATASSTSMMNQMLATVSAGKMTFQQLAGSLSAVLPVAAANKISYAEIGGSLATMTSMGVSAQEGTQELANTITHLANPTSTMTNEMALFGLSSTTVAKNLSSSKTGLNGTIQELSNAVTSKMGPAGLVLVNSMNQSKAAAADAQTMLSQLPTSIQALSKSYLDGGTSYQTWYAATKNLPLTAKTMADQFASVAAKSRGFNNLLTSGAPAAQTYQAAMSKVMGTQSGLNVALMLTGAHATTAAKNIASVGSKADGANGQVSGFAQASSTTAFQLAKAKTSIEAAGTELGLTLLPAVTAVIKPLASMLGWVAGNKAAAIAFSVVVGGVLAAALGTKAVRAMHDLAGAAKDVGQGMEKLATKILGVGKANDAQAASSKKAADASKKASADESDAAEQSAGKQEAAAEQTAAANETAAEQSTAAAETSAGERETASGEAAAAAELDAEETAGANEEAAVASSGSWLTAAGSQIASVATWVAQSAVKVATVVASNVAGAASTAGSWIAAGASQVASAAIWVAQSIAKVAVMVATNVAGAAVTAAAWLIANAAMLLGIGLVVLAVIAAVVLIIKYWKQISSAAVAVWHDVVSGAETAFHAVTGAVKDVIGWVKSNWPLLLAILLGPIAVAALEIAKHWDDIKDGAADVVGDVTRFFESLPGRITSALGDVGHLLYSAGASIIHGLVSGIESAIGDVESTVSGVASTIKSFLPFSPAKQGPLSGSGDPSYSGKSIATKLATGMLAARGTVTSAAGQLAAAASPGGHIGATGSTSSLSAIGPGSGSSGAGVVINLTVSGNTVMSDSDITLLTNKIGNKLATTILPQAGRKINLR